MIKKLPIKIVLAALLLLLALWVLMPRDSIEDVVSDNVEHDPAALVSAIHPISGANANSAISSDSPGVASGRINVAQSEFKAKSLSTEDVASLARRFDNANAAINSGNTQAGAAALNGLIADYPSVIEPYLNLASIYAEQQQLEKARTTLLKGFAANPKAGMLFDHLKKIHSAIAANSYRQALDTNSANRENTKLVLTRVSNIVTRRDQINQIAALQKKLQDSQIQISQSATQAQAEKVSSLESKLSDVQASSFKDRSTYQRELSGLQKQLAEQSQALLLSQTAKREALARVVRAEQNALNEITEITKQLESQKALLVAAQGLAGEQANMLAKAEQQTTALALLEAENIRLTETTAAVIALPKGDGSGRDTSIETLERNAIGLVQSWAGAWSAQDVAAYVNHYQANYSSSRSLSRQQWLYQRQVRLTNKEFIRVKVSDFKVEDLGSQFSVTFSQYYQSNTVDDTVTKRLLFDKDSDDWSQSKIVDERLVSS
ncbi:MAG: hypothetical protein ACJAQ6_000095 [Arenicella sp.]|jgi:hypothetical protein